MLTLVSELLRQNGHGLVVLFIRAILISEPVFAPQNIARSFWVEPHLLVNHQVLRTSHNQATKHLWDFFFFYKSWLSVCMKIFELFECNVKFIKSSDFSIDRVCQATYKATYIIFMFLLWMCITYIICFLFII